MNTIKYIKDFTKWSLVEQPFSEYSIERFESFFVCSRLIILAGKKFFQ